MVRGLNAIRHDCFALQTTGSAAKHSHDVTLTGDDGFVATAQVAHDGFGPRSAGVYFHYLHHAHYDCNYGPSHSSRSVCGYGRRREGVAARNMVSRPP